ncbi:glycosyltransferase [Vallitaleaceae bacterium 9-2]
MLKILEVPAFGIEGGIYQYIFSHLNYMNKADMEIDFLTRNKKLIDHNQIKENNYGVRLFSTTERENKALFDQEILEILDKDYDVIHLHSSYLLGYRIEQLAMKKKVKKVILHSHSSGMELFGKQADEDLKLLHEENKKKFSMQDATDFWACSKKASQWMFGEQIEPSRIKIMKNAIDTDKYKYCKENREYIRSKYNIDNKFVIGHIGRFSYQKNQEFLIEIFEEIFQLRKDIVLFMIGSGTTYNIIVDMIEERNLSSQIILVDWTENIQHYLSAMDLFVLPSRFEGLPLTLVEAQANGLETIVSDLVTKEVDLMNNMKFLPLKEHMWVKEILNHQGNNRRIDADKIIAEAGYDIRQQAKILEKEYRSVHE